VIEAFLQLATWGSLLIVGATVITFGLIEAVELILEVDVG
jgi:hypothetical protein